jgi:hypothetical protein
MCLNAEFRAQYIKLRLVHDDMLPRYKKREWIDCHYRRLLRLEYMDKFQQNINDVEGQQLSTNICNEKISVSQINQLFHNWTQRLQVPTSESKEQSSHLQRNRPMTTIAIHAESSRQSFKKGKKRMSSELQSSLASSTNVEVQVPTSEPSTLTGRGSTRGGRGGRGGKRPRTGLSNPILD